MNKDKARIAELELQLREAEQFARDVAHKLDMPYAPPVAKGDCAYLAALEALKERAEAAEARAGRLDENKRLWVALKKVEWLPSGAHYYCPQCHNIKSLGHHRNCVYRTAEPEVKDAA